MSKTRTYGRSISSPPCGRVRAGMGSAKPLRFPDEFRNDNLAVDGPHATASSACTVQPGTISTRCRTAAGRGRPRGPPGEVAGHGHPGLVETCAAAQRAQGIGRRWQASSAYPANGYDCMSYSKRQDGQRIGRLPIAWRSARLLLAPGGSR